MYVCVCVLGAGEGLYINLPQLILGPYLHRAIFKAKKLQGSCKIVNEKRGGSVFNLFRSISGFVGSVKMYLQSKEDILFAIFI